MNGSKSSAERLFLINLCSKIIFNSEWSKKRFLTDLSEIYKKSEKLLVVHYNPSSANKGNEVYAP